MGLILPVAILLPALFLPLVGYLYDVTGSYALPLTLSLAALVFSAFVRINRN